MVSEQKELNQKLLQSLYRGTPEEIQSLIDAGADNLFAALVSVVDQTPYKDRPEIIDVLVRNGADVNQGTDDISPLGIAAGHGLIKSVRRLIAHGADVNAGYYGYKRQTPLLSAVGANLNVPHIERNRMEIIEMLLDAGAKTDSHSIYASSSGATGYTPLIHAVYENNMELFQLLLQHGADISCRDTDGRSPLFCAKQAKRDEMVDALRKLGAKDSKASKALIEATNVDEAAKIDMEKITELVNFEDADVNAGYAPLCNAIDSGSYELAQFLLDKGANVNGYGGNNFTPLHRAAILGHADVANLLLNRGADVDIVGGVWHGTPLHEAAANGHIAIAETLLERGADINHQDKDGYTPLMRALYYPRVNEEMVELLLEKGANPNIPTTEGKVPLLMALESGNVAVMQQLVDHGADVNVTDKKGKTALAIALEKRYPERIEVLVNGGAKIAPEEMPRVIRDVTGSALYEGNLDQALRKEILKQKNINAVEILIALGADIHAPDEKGATPLMAAASLNRVDVVKALIAHGVDVNVSNNAGKTALHMATQVGNTDVIDLLVANKANVQAADKDGKTPLHIAAQYAQTDALKQLIKAGADLFARDTGGLTPLGVVKGNAAKNALETAGADSWVKRGLSKVSYMMKRNQSR